MNVDAYDALANAVAAAGFYTNGVEDHGSWHRTCICSQRDENGRLTGNSFWVSLLNGRCFLGAWGGSVYELPDPSRLSALCISWLRRAPISTRADFDAQLREEFDLVRVRQSDFEQAAGIS